MLFPDRLYRMLQDSERKGFDSIVSWVGDAHFRVLDREQFEKVVLPQYFESTKFKSFRRQLNFYRFECIRNSRSAYKGCYTHSHFSRHTFDREAVLHLRQQAKCKSFMPGEHDDGEHTSLMPSDPSPEAHVVSPCASHTDGLHLFGSPIHETDGVTEDECPEESLVDRIEPVLWSLDLPDNANEANISQPPRLDIIQQDQKQTASNSRITLFANWLQRVPQDIQDEIVATFSTDRNKDPLGHLKVLLGRRWEGPMQCKRDGNE